MSTSPQLICMVMNIFLWECEMIPHERFWKPRCEILGNRSAGKRGEHGTRLQSKPLCFKFPTGSNHEAQSKASERAVCRRETVPLHGGLTARYYCDGIRPSLIEDKALFENMIDFEMGIKVPDLDQKQTRGQSLVRVVVQR